MRPEADPEFVARWMTEIIDLDESDPIALQIDRPRLACIIGGLQLALRHPEHPEGSREMLMGFIQSVRALFGPAGQELIDKGFDPANDVPGTRGTRPSETIVDDPEKLLGFRIEEITAFIAKAGDEDEGVVAWCNEKGQWMPLVAADAARLESLRPLAAHVSSMTGKRIVEAKFSQRTDIQEIEP